MEKFPPRENQEKQRVNYELDVEGMKIPCWRENFSYPETVQQETQIEGYEKIRITWNNFFDFIQKDLNITENIDEQDHKEKFNKILKIAAGGNTGKEGLIESQFVEKFLGAFSNGKFPYETYNHSLYGDHEYPVLTSGTDSRINVHEEFFNKDFLLGKITNVLTDRPSFLNTKQVIINKDNDVIFCGEISQDYKGDMIGRKYLSLEEAKTEYDKQIRLGKSEILFKKEDIAEACKNNIFLDSEGGLNIYTNKLWSQLDRPSFGFDVNEEPFSKYLAKVNYLYNHISPELINKHNKDCVSFMVKENSSDKFHEEIIGHPYLPIMTGGTGLPALCWGHAKYAVIPTSDSINLLTIKHSKSLEDKT